MLYCMMFKGLCAVRLHLFDKQIDTSKLDIISEKELDHNYVTIP